MGANFASEVATLNLCWCEYRFMRSLYDAAFHPTTSPLTVPPSLALSVLHSFRYTFRFADDLNSLDNPFLPRLLYTDTTFLGIPGIYPRCLTLTPSASSTAANPAVPFLSFTITAHSSSTHGHLVFSLTPYDKRDNAIFQQLPIVRYVHFASCIPMHFKRNIVLNALLCYARHSSTRSTFSLTAARLVHRLHTSYVYPIPFLRNTLRRFYTRHASAFLHLPPWGIRLLRSLLPSTARHPLPTSFTAVS